MRNVPAKSAGIVHHSFSPQQGGGAATLTVFEAYDQIVALCCEAWNRLRDQPWRVMSIGRRAWAHA
jgi:hypothetical protein